MDNAEETLRQSVWDCLLGHKRKGKLESVLTGNEMFNGVIPASVYDHEVTSNA